MAEVLVCYFVEDRAQEGFIKALVERVAAEVSIPTVALRHKVLSSGGGSRVLNDYEKFTKAAQGRRLSQDILGAATLIVAIDGNCKGRNEKVRDLSRYVASGNPFEGKIVFAVPNPHIERWYLLDQRALSAAFGAHVIAGALPLRCGKREKDFYKGSLRQLLKEAGRGSSLLGGSEYGQLVAEYMDLNAAARIDDSFGDFIQDLRSRLRQIKESA